MNSSDTGLQHPLVVAYLDDLSSALAAADPRERAETLDGVREHIRDALAAGGDASDSAVRSVLAQLGPVDPIAADATAVVPGLLGERRDWMPVVVLTAAVVSLAVVVPLPWLGAALALGSLIASLQMLRSSRPSSPLLRAAAVVSGICLAVVAVMAATLLGVSSSSPAPSPAHSASQVSG